MLRPPVAQNTVDSARMDAAAIAGRFFDRPVVASQRAGDRCPLRALRRVGTRIVERRGFDAVRATMRCAALRSKASGSTGGCRAVAAVAALAGVDASAATAAAAAGSACGRPHAAHFASFSSAKRTMDTTALGQSGLQVSKVCLGTMTFGEQVGEADAHDILDHALARGVNFIDTAEMYSVPPRAETYGATEAIIGNWLASRPGVRQRVVLATKVAGPSRNMGWVRQGSANLTPDQIVQACDDSLRRLRTDVIDLYQIHWPNRNAPAFGALYFDPAKDGEFTSIQMQLEALAGLVKAGKVRQIGLSNETPWGVCEFVRLAEQHGLPRIVSVQNPYALVNRALDNGLDETLHRTGVSLLAYSPLGFGTLTGKYDGPGFDTDQPGLGRLARFASMRLQRWARPETLAAARLYNVLARDHGMTPTQLALAFCYRSWRVDSTIIGVTSIAQLDDNLDAWGTALAPELLAAIDAIRWTHRDPAQ